MRYGPAALNLPGTLQTPHMTTFLPQLTLRMAV